MLLSKKVLFRFYGKNTLKDVCMPKKSIFLITGTIPYAI